MAIDPRTGITLLSTQQRYKEELINEGFAHLGAIATGAVVNLSLNSPPQNPNLGEVYFVNDGATGVWEGYENKLALKVEGGWTFLNIPLNHRIYSQQPEGLYRWDGTAWTAVSFTGDMAKSVYDTDNDGVVDAAEVAGSVDWAGVQNKPTIPTNTDIDNRITAQKGQANGLATLGTDSKIPSNQLPAIAITDTFVVNTQAAMLALSAQVGDVAIRTDLNKSFILRLEPASTLANWQELLVSAGGSAISVSDEGVQLTASATSFNFTGVSVTATNSSGAVTVNVAGREVLTVNRTYYVSTTGSDSNNGLAAGIPFLTIQKAIDVVASLDIGIYNVTITLASGNYIISNAYTYLKNPVSSGGAVIIQSTSGNRTDVILGNLVADNSRVYTLKNLTIQSSVNGSYLTLLTIQNKSSVTLSGVRLNNTNTSGDKGAGIGLNNQSSCGFDPDNKTVEFVNNYSWIVNCINNSVFSFQGGVFVYTGTPQIQFANFSALGCSYIELFGLSVTGSTTGGVLYSAVVRGAIRQPDGNAVLG